MVRRIVRDRLGRDTRLFLPLVLVSLSFFCLGMGDMGQKSKKVLRPKKNFKAEIVDVDMTKTRIEFAACGGKTRLQGYNGKTEVLVPFSKIQRIRFSDDDNRYQRAILTFWTGESYELRVKKHLVCSGFSTMGSIRIKVKHLREVVFEEGEYSEKGEE